MSCRSQIPLLEVASVEGAVAPFLEFFFEFSCRVIVSHCIVLNNKLMMMKMQGLCIFIAKIYLCPETGTGGLDFRL